MECLEKHFDIVDVILIIVISVALSIGIGRQLTRDSFRQDAIKHKAAAYICDKETGKVEFKWNNEKNK